MTAEMIRPMAEALLSRAWDGAARLAAGDDLGGYSRTAVYRCRVPAGPPSAPASVVLKCPRDAAAYDPDAPGDLAWSVLNEWAGLEFLRMIDEGKPIEPALYGGDHASGLLVMEDFGAHGRLDQLLLGDDPRAAEEGLVAYARALGRLHARTVGKGEDYARLRDRLGPPQARNSHYSYDWVAPTFEEPARSLGLAPSPAALADAERAAAAMRDPGPLLAYSHGDSCPDNCILVDGAMRLFDFQWSRFGHALLDASTARLHFGMCWCVNRLPAHIPPRMEAAYRAELVEGCPEAADDGLFYRGLLEACAVRVIQFCHDFPLAALLEQDRPIAISTARQIVLLRFDVLADAIAQVGHLAALGATVRETAALLRARWSPDVDELPYYPAFRGDETDNASRS